MDHAILIMGILVIVALMFDFMNGFHDAANSIAERTRQLAMWSIRAAFKSAGQNFALVRSIEL